MKYLILTLALVAASLTGCDQIQKALEEKPSFDLKVGTQDSPVGTWLTIQNMGEKKVTIKKVTINKKSVPNLSQWTWRQTKAQPPTSSNKGVQVAYRLSPRLSQVERAAPKIRFTRMTSWN